MSQHDEDYNEPHQVSEPENPLSYYRRLQHVEAALDRAEALLIEIDVWLEETHAGNGDAGAIGVREGIAAYLRDREGGKR